jgi:hypothetical protein
MLSADMVRTNPSVVVVSATIPRVAGAFCQFCQHFFTMAARFSSDIRHAYIPPCRLKESGGVIP